MNKYNHAQYNHFNINYPKESQETKKALNQHKEKKLSFDLTRFLYSHAIQF